MKSLKKRNLTFEISINFVYFDYFYFILFLTKISQFYLLKNPNNQVLRIIL